MNVRKMLNEARRARLDTIHDYSRVHTGAFGAFDAGNCAEEKHIADAIAAEVARAVAEEREACAEVAQRYVTTLLNGKERRDTARAIRNLIRARGTKEES